mgnify:FL=1
MYDVIIIGAGPAGISASLYTRRANLKTLVLYSDKSSLEKTDKIENYYGFEDGIDGKELYFSGIKQTEKIGTDVKREEVVNIVNEDKKFSITTSKNKYMSKVVILATGNKKNKPQIDGIDRLEGKGISYCAICDGFFYKNKSVAVLGNSKYALSEVNDLINVVKDITVLTNGKDKPEIRDDRIKLETKKIKEIEGKEKVEKIKFEDGSKMNIDGIFIAEGVAGSAEFAKKMGAFIKQNKIIVNENMETNIKGLYACGDCTGGILQISKAVYEGTVAGLQAIKYLKDF